MPPVLDAHAPPDMGGFRRGPKRALEHRRHAVGPLGEDLVGVPIRRQHHPAHLLDELVRNPVVEQVAHRVDENLLRLRPPDGIAQFLRHEAQVEAELEGMAGHTPETLGEGLRVAVDASWADLRAPAHGIPRRVRPLDFRIVAHRRWAPADHRARTGRTTVG